MDEDDLLAEILGDSLSPSKSPDDGARSGSHLARDSRSQSPASATPSPSEREPTPQAQSVGLDTTVVDSQAAEPSKSASPTAQIADDGDDELRKLEEEASIATREAQRLDELASQAEATPEIKKEAKLAALRAKLFQGKLLRRQTAAMEPDAGTPTQPTQLQDTQQIRISNTPAGAPGMDQRLKTAASSMTGDFRQHRTDFSARRGSAGMGRGAGPLRAHPASSHRGPMGMVHGIAMGRGMPVSGTATMIPAGVYMGMAGRAGMPVTQAAMAHPLSQHHMAMSARGITAGNRSFEGSVHTSQWTGRPAGHSMLPGYGGAQLPMRPAMNGPRPDYPGSHPLHPHSAGAGQMALRGESDRSRPHSDQRGAPRPSTDRGVRRPITGVEPWDNGHSRRSSRSPERHSDMRVHVTDTMRGSSRDADRRREPEPRRGSSREADRRREPEPRRGSSREADGRHDSVYSSHSSDRRHQSSREAPHHGDGTAHRGDADSRGRNDPQQDTRIDGHHSHSPVVATRLVVATKPPGRRGGRAADTPPDVGAQGTVDKRPPISLRARHKNRTLPENRAFDTISNDSELKRNDSDRVVRIERTLTESEDQTPDLASGGGGKSRKRKRSGRRR